MEKSASTNWIIVGAVVLVFAGFLIWTTNKKSATTLMRHELTGVVLAIRPEMHKLSVHNQDVPGMMPPMDMDYDVKDPAALSQVKVGEMIHATLVTDGNDLWQLENITAAEKK
jgi:Cu/Ag efflux protein CusF